MRQRFTHHDHRRGATQLLALAFCVGALATVSAGPAVALPASPDATGGASLLPGDVRVWELNHPAGVTPAPLPGDVRVWD